SGAGMSTKSGIPDYRTSVMGKWKKNPEILNRLNERAFQQNPIQLWQTMYELLQNTLSPIMPFQHHQSLLSAVDGIEPNYGHSFFSWLEKQLHKKVHIITQNVDGLHQKAGNQDVIEFHGNIHECICPTCNTKYQ